MLDFYGLDLAVEVQDRVCCFLSSKKITLLWKINYEIDNIGKRKCIERDLKSPWTLLVLLPAKTQPSP